MLNDAGTSKSLIVHCSTLWPKTMSTIKQCDITALFYSFRRQTSKFPESYAPCCKSWLEPCVKCTFVSQESRWRSEIDQCRSTTLFGVFLKTNVKISWWSISETLLEKRANLIDIVAPSPKLIEVPQQKPGAVPMKPGHFPLLNFSVLHKETQIARWVVQ